MKLLTVGDETYNPDNICVIRKLKTQILTPNYTMEDKEAIRIYTANNEGFTSVYNSKEERDAEYERILQEFENLDNETPDNPNPDTPVEPDNNEPVEPTEP